MLSKKVLQYPVTTILSEIDSIVTQVYIDEGFDLWGHNNRHKLNKLHENTLSISLIAWRPKKDDELHSEPMLNYPHKWPEINNFMHLFETRNNCSVRMLNIVKLPPGQVVHPHKDGAKFYSQHDRYHLVLKGTYDMIVDGEHFKYEPGGVYWFDNNKTHSVENGDEERICIIFDTLPNKKDDA